MAQQLTAVLDTPLFNTATYLLWTRSTNVTHLELSTVRLKYEETQLETRQSNLNYKGYNEEDFLKFTAN